MSLPSRAPALVLSPFSNLLARKLLQHGQKVFTLSEQKFSEAETAIRLQHLGGLWPAIAKGRHSHNAIAIARGHHS